MVRVTRLAESPCSRPVLTCVRSPPQACRPTAQISTSVALINPRRIKQTTSRRSRVVSHCALDAEMVQPGRAMLCTSITSDSFEGALAEVAEANTSGADLLELRLDFIKDFESQNHLKTLMGACHLPFIVTCRPKWEGGLYEGDETVRLQMLRQAAYLGAAYIDVEYLAQEAFHSSGEDLPSHTQLILSHHNFSKTLSKEELQSLEGKMRSAGADIVKLAMTAENITDAWTMIELLKEKSGPMVSLSMGERGVVTRILATKYGGYLTFGALGAGRESAPGQPTVDQLKRMYRCNAHTSDTQVFGIIGNPVKHSRSPVLHNAAMATTSYDGVYVPLLVDDMDSFVSTFTDSDWAGYSVTIPHKESACRLSSPDPVAKSIGAVNTMIRTKAPTMEGHNTDWSAAIDAIEAGFLGRQKQAGEAPIDGMVAVVLGTGGAARALAFGAADRGASVIIAGRNLDKATALAEEVNASASTAVSGCSISSIQDGSTMGDILINTTPLGMVGDRESDTPVPQKSLSKFKLVFDAVYTPLETRLLREGKQEGCLVVDGLEMFVGQAADQFKYFTGKNAPVQLMRDTVLASLK